MNTRRLSMLCVSVALTVCAAVQAQTFPIDDSRSQVFGATVAMQWRDFIPKPSSASLLIGQFTVAVHLDVAAWQGRYARVYQRLPAQPNSPIIARWQSQGRLLSGAVRSGERGLVYQGQINSTSLQDTFVVFIEADGDRLTREQALEFSFEIELESP